MSKSTKKKPTIADYMNAVGLAAIALVCFVGLNYMTVGNLPISLCVAIGIAAGFGVVVWLMTYAKTREVVLAKWKIVEWTGLALYLALVVCAFMPFSHAGHIEFDNKDRIRERLNRELNDYENMFVTYKKESQAHLDQYSLALLDMCKGNAKNPVLLSALGLTRPAVQADVDNETDSKTDILLGGDFAALNKAKEEDMDSYSQSFRNWNPIMIPSLINSFDMARLEDLASLQALADKAKVPVITCTAGVWAEEKSSQPFVYAFADQSTVRDMLSSKEMYLGPATLGAYLLIQFFIIIKYLAAQRTSKVRVGGNSRRQVGDDGGVPL